MSRCAHDLPVDEPGVAVADECQVCDWCPRCEAVRAYQGEVCSTCGYVWGEP